MLDICRRPTLAKQRGEASPPSADPRLCRRTNHCSSALPHFLVFFASKLNATLYAQKSRRKVATSVPHGPQKEPKINHKSHFSTKAGTHVWAAICYTLTTLETLRRHKNSNKNTLKNIACFQPHDSLNVSNKRFQKTLIWEPFLA